MSITPADIQKALRMSKVIQEFLENNHAVNVNSTDLYFILADKGLVERDKEQGQHFRAFLTRLVKANMLNLIPQCHAQPRAGGKYVWTFNRAADRMPARKPAPAAAAQVEEPAEAAVTDQQTS